MRTARNKHVCLQNDHVALMKDIELALEKFHSIKKSPPKFDTTDSVPNTRPFAKVEQVKVILCSNTVNLGCNYYVILS